MIAVIDYGVGNLHSILGALRAVHADAEVTGDRDAICAADKIVLPGVGAFGDAARLLRETGLDQALISRARAGVPVLGVCLGMQLLFEKSYEYGEHEGLGLIRGEIAPISADLAETAKVPHMGWNAIEIARPCALTCGLRSGDYVYYVHSFYAKHTDSVSAFSEYGGIAIPGIVNSGNVFGCQFHPEKSGKVGLKILKAFAEVKAAC